LKNGNGFWGAETSSGMGRQRERENGELRESNNDSRKDEKRKKKKPKEFH